MRAQSDLHCFRKVSKRVCMLLVFALTLAGLVACGRYGSPLPPEAFSPEPVRELLVFAELEGIRFQWKSPEKDRRGEELETLDGYLIYRKEVLDDSDVTHDEDEYVEIGSLSDLSVAEREQRRKEAREQGKLTRRVQAKSELQEFEFIDQDLSPGNEYLYKIVGVNQGGIEGSVQQLVRVMFRGRSSEILLVSDAEIEEVL